jgi:Fic family protein
MARHITPPPPWAPILLGGDNVAELRDIKAPGYPHWDKLRHLDAPEGITNEEWWAGLKVARLGARPIPLVDIDKRPFVYNVPAEAQRLLHVIDTRAAGDLRTAEVAAADAQAEQKHIVNSLMEEAIRSSQLEGASTSQRVAKEMLRSGREPVDRSERMILNNYVAMVYMREAMGDHLMPADILELHAILTEGTLDDTTASGRLQTPDEERVAVVNRLDGGVLHRPPPAAELPARMELMCAFANGETDAEDEFIHPVVRAILLHFWLAYDHPFLDGNGRTARVLFFWLLRKHGYWLAEYLSISKILREAPGQYQRAFLYTETDDNDATYFVLHQLDVIGKAIEDMHKYLQRKSAEVRSVEDLLRGGGGFNHRQIALLSGALRNDDRVYTYGLHARTHGVTHETARTDLRDLADRELLDVERIGRRYRFRPPRDLAARLKALGDAAAGVTEDRKQ